MRIVIALGGNALLRRGQKLTAENQRINMRVAAAALAPIAMDHELVISHGNGPQVGLLALQGAAYKPDEAFPLDILGAQTEGMIGYMIEQEVSNFLPAEKPLATLLTMIEVDAGDPAFQNPSKFVGPVYGEAEASILAEEKGWAIKQDGDKWRRVVPSPMPKRIFDIRPIKWLLERETVVICAGGGGIPIRYDGNDKLEGVEAVIDKDFASELLSRDLDADMFIMATDVNGVYLDWNSPEQRNIRYASATEIRKHDFAAGSMGPKVEAACQFAEQTGKKAAIGNLADIEHILNGTRGTTIEASGKAMQFYN